MRTLWIFFGIFWVAFVCLAASAATTVLPCKQAELRKGLRCWVEIKPLRAIQPAVGKLHVQKHAKLFSSLTAEEFRARAEKKPGYVVIGPGKELFLFDGNHKVNATHEAGYTEYFVHVVDDLSHLTEEQFWREMQRQGQARLKDVNGQSFSYGRIAEKMPKFVLDAADDPFRSLASSKKIKGLVLNKEDVPLVEFQWADYLRQKIDPEILEKDWDLAERLAIFYLLRPEAASLPGYLGKDSTVLNGGDCADVLKGVSLSDLLN